VISKIYIPKFNVKLYAPFMYSGEKSSIPWNHYRNLSDTPKGPSENYKNDKRLLLGIESSFDDTCASVVEGTGAVLSNIRKSYLGDKHESDMPIKVAAHHEAMLPGVVEQALADSGKGIKDMAGIAVTMGPGQQHSLKRGLDFAKALGMKFDLPVIPVNHIEAHTFTGRM
jgi:tRNA A37 threonylcarbamoyltransferase TsaD